MKITVSNSVFASLGKNLVSRGNIPSYCHYTKIFLWLFGSRPQEYHLFPILKLMEQGKHVCFSRRGCPIAVGRKILHTQGLHILWSTSSHSISQPKTAWRSAKTVNLSERMMCSKRLMERLYVWLFYFQEYPYWRDLLMSIECSLNALGAIVPITILFPFLFI